MSILFSIDLDYYDNCVSKSPEMEFRWVIRYLKNHLNTIKNIVLVDSHEEILNYINEMSFTKIINIDYHNDFVLLGDHEQIGDYNWVNFTPLKKGVETEYIWVYPEKEHMCNGVCDGEKQGSVFKEQTKFNSVRKKMKFNKTSSLVKPEEQITFIGICISSNYVTRQILINRLLDYLIDNFINIDVKPSAKRYYDYLTSLQIGW